MTAPIFLSPIFPGPIMTDSLFFVAFALILLAAAVQDIRHRRISNVFPLLLVLLFVVFSIWRDEPPDLLSHITSFAFVFAICAALFARGMLGGGDVKLMAAASLWFEVPLLPLVVLAVALCGGALAVVSIARGLHRSARAEGPARSSRHAGTVPYGVAIAGGAMIVAWHALSFC